MDKAKRASRTVVALWTAVLLVAGTVIVVLSTGTSQPALAFQQVGHWVYNAAQKALLHVDGGTKQVDAKIDGVDADPGSQAVQGDRDVYLVSGRKVIVFGKSKLTVDDSVAVDIGDEPVGIEVVGGPYLVYQRAGTIVRFGKGMTKVAVGGEVTHPVATPEGTVWVNRQDNRALCRLQRDKSDVRCPASVPDGHSGALSVVGDDAVFVDVVSGAAHVLSESGLGKAVQLGVTLPERAQVADHGVAGRLPVLDQDRDVLLLTDVSGMRAGRTAAPAVPIALEPGDYSKPVSSKEAVSVLDHTRNRLLTFGPDGRPRSTTELGKGRSRMTRGEDGRVYVDDVAGERLLVVDVDGKVSQVDVNAKTPPKAQTAPVVPPQAQLPPPPPAPKPADPAKPAAPPGAPASVSAQPGNSEVSLSWAAAPANGGAISSYQVTWRTTAGSGTSGARTVAGNDLSARIDGLRNGSTYVFTVGATNSAGSGPTTDSSPVKPSSEIPGEPSDVRAEAAADGSVNVTWQAADGQGHDVTSYSVTATGADGSTSPAQPSTGTNATIAAGVLQVGQQHTFKVTATNDLGLTGKESPESNSVTPYEPAAAPGAFTATPGDGTLALAWTEPDLGGGDLVGYVVAGNGVPSRTVTTTSTTYTGLANGTARTMTVHALTREQGRTSGPQATGATATTTATPGTSPLVHLTGAGSSGDRQITVNVNVDTRGSGAVTCHVVFNGATRWTGGCAGAQGITVGGLAYATTYDIYVEGSNSYGRGPASGHASVRTNDPPPPPRTVTVSKGASTSRPGECGPPCNFVQIEVRNFAPNATFRVDCDSPPGASYWNYTLRTNGSGAASSAVCFYGYGGRQVAARVDGVPSNVIVW
ncbi:hypothetical protein GCM10011609_02620 [Lentzea pudingi]|uniref:Fibronectin type-III domain-containing protein n=1 Tax=Lentzea pudingi TaxID=1789439 RepID=A0ABQ2HAN7_9PSEU|nr:fibronectin type III domain-containing protein [Lentzea pudingi]GGM70407.1 hypothetical protein GCM10011609_02620 [Lentzea pudingi]